MSGFWLAAAIACAVLSVLFSTMAGHAFGINDARRSALVAADEDHNPLHTDDVVRTEDPEAFDALQQWVQSGYTQPLDEAIWPRVRTVLERQQEISRANALYWRHRVKP